MEMASTTLVTFLYECPAAAHSVELLGSWDNFTKSYRLKRDTRRGRHIWSGCHTFDNIICDGDLANLCEKRNGPLLMGGTYWYYYKVDDSDEHHNPAQPSTTVCPLLPGQRLNILEVPMESRTRSRSSSGSSSASSTAFTRNPQDKFLNPVPPKPLPTPPLDEKYDHQPYLMTLHVQSPPRSPFRSLSPARSHHSRKTSSSPSVTAPASFGGLKDKFSRSTPTSQGYHSRKSSRNVRNLEIGPPILVSTTADDMHLIPLPSSRSPPESSRSLPARLTSKLKEFGPLTSHPVDTDFDFDVGSARSAWSAPGIDEMPSERSRYDRQFQGHLRANSSGIRRTRVFNGVWDEVPKSAQAPKPMFLGAPGVHLQRPMSSDERPQSRHGGVQGNTILKKPLTDKELPELPRYLKPAPLFACHSPSIPDFPDVEAEEEEEIDNSSIIDAYGGPSSRFSAWTLDSTALTSPTDQGNSPTFSSFTTNGSEDGMGRYDSEKVDKDCEHHELQTEDIVEEEERDEDEDKAPKLQLRDSALSPHLFQLDIQRPESAPRRQAAVFGLPDNLKYLSLADDEDDDKNVSPPSVPVEHQSSSVVAEKDIRVSATAPRLPSTTISFMRLDQLASEFGYLSEAVI